MRTPRDSQSIARIAYHLWEQEGRPVGRDLHHWQQAEKQLAVEFRVGFPDATGDEDPDSYLSSSDSDRASVERQDMEPQRPDAAKI